MQQLSNINAAPNVKEPEGKTCDFLPKLQSRSGRLAHETCFQRKIRLGIKFDPKKLSLQRYQST